MPDTDTTPTAVETAPEGTEPEAPVTAAEPEATETAEVPKPTPVREAMDATSIRREARERADAKAAERGEAPPHHSETQPRDEGGKFTEEETTEPGESTAEAEGTATSETEPTGPADGFVRLDVPSGHPMLDRGKSYLDVPAESERDVRSLLNDPVRRAAVTAAEERVATAEREAARLKARLDALASPEAKALDDPKHQAVYDDLKEAYGEEYADQYLAGLDAQKEKLVEDRTADAIAAAEMTGVARQFLAGVEQHAPGRYGVWQQSGELAGHLSRALQSYSARVDAVGETPDVNAFFADMDAQYIRDPRVQTQIKEWESNQQAAREKALEEKLRTSIREDLTKEAADARTRHRTNPMGRLPAVSTGARSTAVDGGDDIESLTPGQLKRTLRERAAARATVGGTG